MDTELPYEEALAQLGEYSPPTQTFVNQAAGKERLPIYNQVINKSDLYKMEEGKQDKRRIKEQKEQQMELKRQENARKQSERNLMNNILQHKNMKKCGCRSLCTGNCTCRKNDQPCNQFCSCNCENKVDL